MLMSPCIRCPLLALIFLLVMSAATAAEDKPGRPSDPMPSATPSLTSDEISSEEAGQPLPDIELNPVHARYSASLKKGIPFKGSATRSLEQREDGLWEYRFNVDSFIADIRETLILDWNGRRVIPLDYRYRLDSWLVSDRAADLDFDWEKFRVLNDVENQPWYMDIHAGVLDKLGFQLQLRQDLKAGKQRMVYEIADGGELKEYEFAVVGKEVIDTENHGKVKTIRVEKVREPYKERETDLWFAPQWDYLLMRLVQIESDGTRYEINLEEARLPGQRIE